MKKARSAILRIAHLAADRDGRATVLAGLCPVLLLLWGCSATKPEATPLSPREMHVDLDALVQRLPARDAAEERWAGNILVDSAPESITRLCIRLDTLGPGTDAKVRYALSGATVYATLPGHERERAAYSGALSAALDNMRSPGAMAFVMEQLQVAGGTEAVPALNRFLANESLYDHAAMALVAIGTPEAEARLLEAARNKDGPRRLTLIQSLGELKSRGAVADLTGWARGDDAAIRQASMAALAAIGDPQSADLIRDPSLQAVYAARLAEQKNNALAERVCRSLLSGEGQSKPHVRLAALRILADLVGERAMDDLVTAVQDPNPEVRSGALEIAAGIKGEGATERWISVMKQAGPEARAGVVRMLGQRNDPSAVPVVYNALKDQEPSVRVAAIGAAAQLGGGNTIDSILVLLERTEHPEEISAVRDALLPLPQRQSVPAAIRVLDSATPPGTVMLLQFLSGGGSLVTASSILPLTRDASVEVRLAAMKALENVAGPDDIPALVKLLMEERDEREWTAIQRSIAAAAARIPDPNKRADALLVALDDGVSGETRTRLLRTLGRVGGAKAVAVLARGAAGSDPAVKDASIRALAEAPGIEGFEALLGAAQRKNPLATRVLALRGSLKMVTDASLPPIRSVPLLARVLAASERPEEKRLVLAALGKAGSREALRIASGYLRNDTVGLDAALAIRTMAATGAEETPARLSRQDLVRNLFERNASPKVLARLNEYDEARSEMNKPPQGFVALFNGKNLDGWKGLVADPPTRAKMTAAAMAGAQAKADSLMRAQWSVEDGVIKFNGEGFANLCTVKDFTNFELLVDWKIEKEGDSGIYLRGSPQVQIWDPNVGPEGSGGLYNNQKNPRMPMVKADKPAGYWNTFRIRMIGDRVTVHLNDVLVTDNVVLENYWEREKPIYPTGQIELQAHDSPLYFRNIYIQELPSEKEKFSGLLFNGKDLTGWEPVGGSTPWGVEDGVLYTEGGGGGWISTVEQYDNFKLELEFRVPEGGNSGVFLRTPREGDPAYVGMEVQVLDDYAPVYAGLRPWQYTGSIYGVQAPSVRATKKAGEWQRMVIVADGPHVTVTLNDRPIIDADLVSHMELERTHPGLKRRGGYIGLQNHSTKVEYRNIRITEL